jgi:hypothetical protein
MQIPTNLFALPGAYGSAVVTAKMDPIIYVRLDFIFLINISQLYITTMVDNLSCINNNRSLPT